MLFVLRTPKAIDARLPIGRLGPECCSSLAISNPVQHFWVDSLVFAESLRVPRRLESAWFDQRTLVGGIDAAGRDDVRARGPPDGIVASQCDVRW